VLFAFGWGVPALAVPVDIANHSGSRTSDLSAAFWVPGVEETATTRSAGRLRISRVSLQLFRCRFRRWNIKEVPEPLILQVSPNFTAHNLLSAIGVIVDPTTCSPEDPGNSNWNLPGEIDGVRFDSGSDRTRIYVCTTPGHPSG
jgi:hypothetical protein